MPDHIDVNRLLTNANIEKFTPLQAAERQLDRAITLFIAEKDYLCAITLAGAADGIIGEALRAEGKSPAVELFIHEMSIGALKGNKLLAELIPDELTIRDLNRMRNLLKHHQIDLNSEIEVATDLEAFNLILRTVINYGLLTENVTAKSVEFLDWVRNNRPEILEVGEEFIKSTQTGTN